MTNEGLPVKVSSIAHAPYRIYGISRIGPICDMVATNNGLSIHYSITKYKRFQNFKSYSHYFFFIHCLTIFRELKFFVCDRLKYQYNHVICEYY